MHSVLERTGPRIRGPVRFQGAHLAGFDHSRQQGRGCRHQWRSLGAKSANGSSRMIFDYSCSAGAGGSGRAWKSRQTGRGLMSAWFPIVPEYVKYVADYGDYRWHHLNMWHVPIYGNRSNEIIGLAGQSRRVCVGLFAVPGLI